MLPQHGTNVAIMLKYVTVCCDTEELCRWPKDKLALYTFGAPKVGNNEFAKTLESCIPNAWRIFSVTDVLPETPVASEYVHAGHACSFTQGLSSVGHIMFQYTPWLTVEGPGNVPVSSEVPLLTHTSRY